jgi:hypothetical protein
MSVNLRPIVTAATMQQQPLLLLPPPPPQPPTPLPLSLLSSLSLGWCRDVDDGDVAALAPLLPSLRSLCLAQTRVGAGVVVGGVAGAAAGAAAAGTATTAALSSCALAQIARHCHFLEELDLSFTPVGDASLAALRLALAEGWAAGLVSAALAAGGAAAAALGGGSGGDSSNPPSSSSFSLNQGPGDADGFFARRPPDAHPLRRLSLRATRVTDAGVEALFPAADAPPSSSSSSPSSPSSSPPPPLLSNLRALDLSLTRAGNAAVRAVAQAAPKLTELALEQCAGVTDACCAQEGVGLAALFCLERLDLSDTAVTDAGIASCAPRLPRLRRIDLTGADAGDGAAAALGALVAAGGGGGGGGGRAMRAAAAARRAPRPLEEVRLDARRATDASVRALRPCGATLQVLDLFGARVGPRGVAHLVAPAEDEDDEEADGAAAARPSATPVVAAGPPCFSALVRLELCSGLLNDRACEDLARLTTLRHLSVSQNPRIGDAGLRALVGGAGGGGGGSGGGSDGSGGSSTPPAPGRPSSGLLRLETLNLTYTGVGDAGLPALLDLPRLRSVALSFSRVTAAGVEALRRRAAAAVAAAAGGAHDDSERDDDEGLGEPSAVLVVKFHCAGGVGGRAATAGAAAPGGAAPA